MDEKVLIQGNFTKKNTLTIACLVLAVICMVISIAIYNPFDNHDNIWDHGYLYTALTFDCPEGVGVLFYVAILFVITAMFFWFEMSYCELTVTNKRVYGKTAFGKMIDLPYDEISSVGTCFPQGVFAATSSGSVRFWLMTNQADVYNSISDLLRKRQNKEIQISTRQEIPQSNADELKKYKELLDSGVITQEEFDAKKKQLLGL